MKLPNRITIQVLNNSKFATDLICSVQLLTHQKNNFSLGIYKTDNTGRFIITKDNIVLKIKEAVELFLMDYNSSPKNIKGSIEIKIENSEDLKNRVSRIEEFFPEKGNEVKSILMNNKNDAIVSTVTEILPIKDTIVINI